MIFDFNQRVRVIACERTIADRTADCTGYIAGKSQEDDSTEVVSYAVFLDTKQRVYMIAPDDLSEET